jgi:hypothetical protein
MGCAHVTGEMLTIVLTVAGIGVGFATSLFFSVSAKREAQAKHDAVLQQNSSLHQKISILQNLLSSVVKSAVETDIGVDQAPRSAQVSGKSSVDLLVRASLGALLNEYGEVSVQRLLREVGHARPGVSPSSVLSSLEDLRETGMVSWAGDDLRKAGVVVVHSQ